MQKQKDQGSIYVKRVQVNIPRLWTYIFVTLFWANACITLPETDISPDPITPPQYEGEKKTTDRTHQENFHAYHEVNERESDQQRLDEALESYQVSQRFWTEGNCEEAIGALDRAYGLILQVTAEGNHQLLQQKEDLRFLISRRILEIYASRHTGVSGNHQEIPLVSNSYVEAEIRNFLNHERTFFLESYKRSGRYRPMVLEELKRAGLPEELSWLPLIESGFKTKALSRSRALGLWQFISSTGYKFGLQRNKWIDERMDPKKSTVAAIAYLTELHGIFGDWTTVLAAYNCGEGAVLRVIKTQKINYLDNFWDLYERLPLETARYVPRFLAAIHIINDPEKFGMTLGEPDKPLIFEEVKVNKHVRLKDVANHIAVPQNTLACLNPELRHEVTPNSEYMLKVPPGTSQLLVEKLDKIPQWKPPQVTYVYHRIRRGETLSHIARKYGVSVSAIARFNHIRQKNRIREGKRIKIPLRSR